MQELLYKKREELSSVFREKNAISQKQRLENDRLASLAAPFPFCAWLRQKEYMTISTENAMIGRNKSSIAKGREQ